ncbi:TIR domain-containing protein [Tengunoibacter tsumagoiensis]|uniref:TIR domain-containing protein n=1 Tax=Tengunoibacter tsumagoiensis TaxID=2014871 RepID=A0A402A9V8_9CHLR|nr:TIR domain-containing protein [Tengunoibacter tsumagoiensis]GCE15964.1 hypothetical protein KTT_58230 [Tengunoibacter tsumagoiensis]
MHLYSAMLLGSIPPFALGIPLSKLVSFLVSLIVGLLLLPGLYSGIFRNLFARNKQPAPSSLEEPPFEDWEVLKKQWKEGAEERARNKPIGLTLDDQTILPKNLQNPIALSPNGAFIASGSRDTMIRLWDLYKQQNLTRLNAHTKLVSTIAWSPNNLLVSGANDKTVRIWDVNRPEPLNTLEGHQDVINAIAWSPDGSRLASGSDDKTLRIWDTLSGRPLKVLPGHPKGLRCVVWSPDGKRIATGGNGGLIRIWNAETGQPIWSKESHTNGVYCLAWSPQNAQGSSYIASGGKDETIRIWNPSTGREERILEGHSNSITRVSFSHDGLLLASLSPGSGAEIIFWRTDTWERVATLPINPSARNPPMAFQPNEPKLLTLGEELDEIAIWHVDSHKLIERILPSIQYVNAKVVLVGDTGVGKTGLGLVLSSNPFVPTVSTHGRHIWTLKKEEVVIHHDKKELHEIILWDLAGQPGYRIIHQLHLNEVTVALIVFDGASETNPFAGVRHWTRALRQAQQKQREGALPLKIFLIEARIDRGGIGVSDERIKALIQECGIDAHFKTSAKSGENIPELRQAIIDAIQWQDIPPVNSTELFQQIKGFLLEEKKSGQLLVQERILYRIFAKDKIDAPSLAQFITCIKHVEASGFIKRLNFEEFVLLQPEYIDAYGSALMNAVRDEPDGLGSISEDDAKQGRFKIPTDERIKDKKQEQFLLLAMIDDLLYHELVLREQTNTDTMLIFPSQSTIANKEMPNPKGKIVSFTFEGPTRNIYTTLAVRLARSELFTKKDLWQDAITYKAATGGTCGLFLQNREEGEAELILFATSMGEETQKLFVHFVTLHLLKHAIPGSIERQYIIICPNCKEEISARVIQLRQERGFKTLNCPICDTLVNIDTGKQRLDTAPLPTIIEMESTADSRRDLAMLQARRSKNDQKNVYDVFLCYNEADSQTAKQIADHFIEHGIIPWIDQWEADPDNNHTIQEYIHQIKNVTLCIGKDGQNPSQQPATQELLQAFLNQGATIISVILPEYQQEMLAMPLPMGSTVQFDLRDADKEEMNDLINYIYVSIEP